MTFLCATHREWLYFHSEEGTSFIEDSHRKGEYLIQQEQWKNAIPFVGGAFEATEILLELYGSDKTWLLTELTLLAILLVDCMHKINKSEQAQSINQRALTWLYAAQKQQSDNSNNVSFVQNCISYLTGPNKEGNIQSAQVNSAVTSSVLH